MPVREDERDESKARQGTKALSGSGSLSRRRSKDRPDGASTRLTTIGLFAGIGGIELGMHRAGHRCVLLCEVDPDAQAVLALRFPGVRLHTDIRNVKRLPAADVWTAGFPCKDLSQAGLT